jgi:hypothetical protein
MQRLEPSRFDIYVKEWIRTPHFFNDGRNSHITRIQNISKTYNSFSDQILFDISDGAYHLSQKKDDRVIYAHQISLDSFLKLCRDNPKESEIVASFISTSLHAEVEPYSYKSTIAQLGYIICGHHEAAHAAVKGAAWANHTKLAQYLIEHHGACLDVALEGASLADEPNIQFCKKLVLLGVNPTTIKDIKNSDIQLHIDIIYQLQTYQKNKTSNRILSWLSSAFSFDRIKKIQDACIQANTIKEIATLLQEKIHAIGDSKKQDDVHLKTFLIQLLDRIDPSSSLSYKEKREMILNHVPVDDVASIILSYCDFFNSPKGQNNKDEIKSVAIQSQKKAHPF